MILYIFGILFCIFILNFEDVKVNPFDKTTGYIILGVLWPLTLSALVFKWADEMINNK